MKEETGKTVEKVVEMVGLKDRRKIGGNGIGKAIQKIVIGGLKMKEKVNKKQLKQ